MPFRKAYFLRYETGEIIEQSVVGMLSLHAAAVSLDVSASQMDVCGPISGRCYPELLLLEGWLAADFGSDSLLCVCLCLFVCAGIVQLGTLRCCLGGLRC